jgi:hypothetical protein
MRDAKNTGQIPVFRLGPPREARCAAPLLALLFLATASVVAATSALSSDQVQYLTAVVWL